MSSNRAIAASSTHRLSLTIHEQQRGQLDEIDGGMLAAVLPIGIEDPLDEVGIKKAHGTSIEAAEWDPNADGLAHEGEELGAANLDGRGLAWGVSPATGRAGGDLRQTRKVAIDVSAEVSGELFEGWTSKRRLWRGLS